MSLDVADTSIQNFSVQVMGEWRKLFSMTFNSQAWIVPLTARNSEITGALTSGALEINDDSSASLIHVASVGESVVDIAPLESTDFLTLDELALSGLLPQELMARISAAATSWNAWFVVSEGAVGVFAVTSGSIEWKLDQSVNATVNIGGALMFELISFLESSEEENQAIEVISGIAQGKIGATISLDVSGGIIGNLSMIFTPGLELNLSLAEMRIIIHVTVVDPENSTQGGVIGVSFSPELLGANVTIETLVNSERSVAAGSLEEVISYSGSDPASYLTITDHTARLFLYLPRYSGTTIEILGRSSAPAPMDRDDLVIPLAIAVTVSLTGFALVIVSERRRENDIAELEGIDVDDLPYGKRR